MSAERMILSLLPAVLLPQPIYLFNNNLRRYQSLRIIEFGCFDIILI